tara:strand:- start:70314 stop:72455 length:2142 start_codon:yes stop_codon:yes gene_type:complete
MSDLKTLKGYFAKVCDGCKWKDGPAATAVHGIFEQKWHGKKKRDVDAMEATRVIVAGHVPSKSMMMMYNLLVKPRTEDWFISNVATEVSELYDEDMTVMFYSIERVILAQTFEWSVRNMKHRLQLSGKMNIVHKNLKVLAGDPYLAKKCLSENKVWKQGDRPSLYRDILEAARMTIKSDLYWKVCVYFPPHVVRFCHLKDEQEQLSSMYKMLTDKHITPDIALHKYRKCWKYEFYDRQIVEIVKFWRHHNMFKDPVLYAHKEDGDLLVDFEKRFEIVKYALRRRNLCKETIYHFSEAIENFDMDPLLMLHKVFYKLEEVETDDLLDCKLFGTDDLYCFWDDYVEALTLKGLLNNLEHNRRLYFAKGYPESKDLQNDVGFVISKAMLCYVNETLCPEKLMYQPSNWHRLHKAKSLKFDMETTTIWLFGCEYFCIPDLINALKFFKTQKCKLCLHFFGHFEVADFSKKSFNLLSWFPQLDKPMQTFSENPPFMLTADDEVDLKTNETLRHELFKKDVVKVAFNKKEKEKYTKSLHLVDEKQGKHFFKGQDGTVLISKNMQVTPNSSIISNKTFSVAYVNDIIWNNCSYKRIAQKEFNYQGKEIKVEIKMDNGFVEYYPPKDLLPEPVICFSQITHPLKRVALVGTGWPKWAVDVFRKYLCTDTLFYTTSFEMTHETWNTNNNFMKESVYSKTIKTPIIVKKINDGNENENEENID